jgi:hypothetical protein
VLSVPYCPGSARGGHFSKGLADYNIGNVQQFLKKYLQCVLAARILTVDFVVGTLAVKKKIIAGFDLSDRTIPLSGLPSILMLSTKGRSYVGP